MKCPYCKEDMKLGVIHGERYALKWIPKEKDRALFPWLVKGIKLSYALDGNSVEAFYCEGCKKIIIDAEDKIDQRK